MWWRRLVAGAGVAVGLGLASGVAIAGPAGASGYGPVTTPVVVADEETSAVLLGIAGLTGGLVVGTKVFGSWL